MQAIKLMFVLIFFQVLMKFCHLFSHDKVFITLLPEDVYIELSGSQGRDWASLCGITIKVEMEWQMMACGPKLQEIKIWLTPIFD